MSSLPNKSLEPTPVTKARFVGVICGAAQLNRYVPDPYDRTFNQP